MGLAASQCRLLFITSRQNDVSAKMQRISNDRLVLSRDEDDAYAKYSRIMNATKFEAAKDVDLSYAAMMSSGQILTDSDGRVILDSSTYNELKQNGYITNDSGTGKLNLGAKNTFVAKMAGLTEEQQNAPTFNQFVQSHSAEYPRLIEYPTKPAPETKEVDKTLEKSSSELVGSSNGMDNCRSSGNHTWDMDGAKKEAADGVKSIIGSFVGALETRCKNAFNGLPADLKAQVDKAATDAASITKPEAQRSLGETHGGMDDGSAGAQGKLGYYTNYYASGVIAQYKHANSHCDKQKIADKFFAEFKTALNQSGSTIKFEYTVKEKNDAIIKEWETQYKAAQKAWKDALLGLGIDDAAKNKMSKYERMYDNLNNREFIKKDLDANAIAEGIGNGRIFVNGELGTDLVNEVADEETRKEAETWYDHELKKIKRKEDQMDTELNKYQTEYSALTQDYNSVKSIIDANVQKSFTYCQNG